MDEKQKKMENAGNPLLLLFIFGMIMAFLFFIPEVYEKYNAEKAALYGIGNKSSNNDENKEKQEQSKESDYFNISGNTVFNNFVFNNVNIENGILSLNVKSKLSGSYSLNNEKYYIELYKSSEEKTLLGRRILKTEETITDQREITIQTDINGIITDENTIFRIIYVTDDAIPDVSLENNTLTCSKNNEVYVYEFSDNLALIKLDYKITNNKDESLSTYQSLKERLDNLNGVTTNITEEETTYTFNTVLDYKISKFFKIDLDNRYDGNTFAKTVKFKNEAKGYDCK